MKISKLLFTIIILSANLLHAEESNSQNNQEIETQSIQKTTISPTFDAERWKKLMALIDSEIKTIKGNKYSGPELKHRLFELYSEKIRLIKEKENLNLLKADIKIVQKNGKESFFKASTEQYKTAQAYAVSIVKQYPKFQRIAEIYYALAINSRDFGTSSETEKYLKLAIAQPQVQTKTLYNAKTALAEYYYNTKKYHEAIEYYTDVLKNSEDEWYGKHLYNASWCHLKERNFKKALELMKLSFETTKNKKFVSMKEQVFNAIGIFFVQADATYEGIDFFELNAQPASSNLLSLAQSSMNKNNFNITEDILKAALKDTRKNKDPNAELKIRLGQLDIYRESKKDEYFFETANSILELNKKNKLNQDDIFIAQNKIKEVAGFMQINLVKDKTKEPISYSKEDYKKIMRYFDILSVLDRPNKNLFRYYQGETALSIQEHHTALKYYVRSIMNSKLVKDKGDITRKSLESMLSVLEIAKLPKERENEYTIFAFKNFVTIYPQSDKSQAIYQKLFNKYFELKRIKHAVNILLVYQFYYKADDKIHREMLTQILDQYIKEKNTIKLAFWVGKIEKGYLDFSSDYIQNSIAVLGELLFDKYQALEKKGQIKEAMKGYESIYESKQYPKRTKAEAAYAISALTLEQNKAKDSFKWLKKSLELYDSKELKKVTASLFVLSKGYRLLQHTDISTEVAIIVSQKFCGDLYKNKEDFYQILNENSIIQEEKIDSLIKVQTEYSKCELSDKLISRTQTENMERLIFADRLKDAITYFKAFPENQNLSKMMEKYLKYKFYQNPEATQKDILSVNNLIDMNSTVNQYQNIQTFISKINDLKFIFTSDDKFNEEKYNLELEQYFSIIQELNNEAMALSKLSSPQEIILLRNNLGKPYFSLVKSINNVNPKGVDKRYFEGFKQGMRQITESLTAKALQVDKEKMAFLEKNNYFFEVQKNDIVGVENKNQIEKELNFHSAILFSNTLDIGSTNSTSNNRIVAGQ